MPHSVVIRFEGIEEWEESRQDVDRILQEATGQDQFPSTRSLPPIIIGPEIEDDTIEKLRALRGVIVDIRDD